MNKWQNIHKSEKSSIRNTSDFIHPETEREREREREKERERERERERADDGCCFFF